MQLASKRSADASMQRKGGVCAAGCGSVNANLVCSRCGQVTYCSKDCQRRAWHASHKKTCCIKGKVSPSLAADLSAELEAAIRAIPVDKAQALLEVRANAQHIQWHLLIAEQI
jgi:MYND finger